MGEDKVTSFFGSFIQTALNGMDTRVYRELGLQPSRHIIQRKDPGEEHLRNDDEWDELDHLKFR